MKNLGLLFIIASCIVISSCCSTADCSGGPELAFSVVFITPEGKPYYFDESEDVDLTVFYEDSTFVNVNKLAYGEPDSRTITFIWDVDGSVDHYSILANDTLLGELNLAYGIKESKCCDAEISIADFEFDSEQEFITEFGLQIIL